MSAPLVCAAIGAGALVYATSAKRSRMEATTCASARVASPDDPPSSERTIVKEEEGVSARRTTMTTDLDDGDMWSFSEDAETQFAAYTAAPLNANSEKVKNAKRELAPRRVDSRATKSIGTTVLAAGRAENTVPQPKVSGECGIFNMSPAMAQKIYESEMLEITEE